MMAQLLNFTPERLNLSFVRGQLRSVLVMENIQLPIEDSDSVLDIDQIGDGGPGTTPLASVDLVEAGGQGDEAGHREND
jgi:hypothetical protein